MVLDTRGPHLVMSRAVIALAVASLTWLDGAHAKRVELSHRLEPVEFAGSFPEYYSPHGQPNIVVLENIRRGHEGMLVKLSEVTKSIQEDELKLNNVFFKLGQHDSELLRMEGTVTRLTSDSRRIEAKLNKHAYNVDFLRRNMDSMTGQLEKSSHTTVQMTALQATIIRLEDRLAETLARLSVLENATDTLEKRSIPSHEDFRRFEYGSPIYIEANKPPTLIVHLPEDEGVCKSSWNKVGEGCFKIAEEELNFVEAIAACFKAGGQLVTVPADAQEFNTLKSYLHRGIYWTSSTDAFTAGEWLYLVTGHPVLPSHWKNFSGRISSHVTPHTTLCGALTSKGLEPLPCTRRLRYLCQQLAL